MRKLLIAALLGLLPSLSLADSKVSALAAGTSLTGSLLYLDQGPGADRKLGFDTASFCVSSNNLALCAGLTLTSPTIAGGTLSGTLSGSPTFSGAAPLFTGLSAGTQVSCMGLDAGNHLVLNAAACGAGGGGGGTVTNPGNLVTHAPVIGGANGTTDVKTTTALTNGQLLVGATGADPAPQSISGDGTLTSGGALTITKTSGVSFGALATTVPGTGVATFLATPTSANLAAALTDETGTGAAVFAGSPALTGTPTAPTATVGTNTTQLATTAFVLANTSGGAVSVTAATPNLVVTPSPGTGTFTIGGTNAQNSPPDAGSHSYTVLSGDLAKEVVLVNTFTGLAVPQATGSFAAGASFSAVTQSAVTATSTTSTVNGIAGATGIKLGANQFSQWDALGGNWIVGLGLPQPATQTGTTFLRDDMTWVAPAITIASGTSALGTGSISSAACATVVTTSAPNTATTDVVTASFNGDPTGVTGYIPATAGMLTIISYPTSGNVNFKVCNNTGSSIVPGAITLNWRVVR